MEEYQTLLQFVQELKTDCIKTFDLRQRSGATRLRKKMLELKKLAQALRMGALEAVPYRD